MTDALVLAGSLNNGSLQTCSEESYEALIKVGPRVLVQYVTNALMRCEEVSSITVVGPPKLKSFLYPGIKLVQSGETLMENLILGSRGFSKPFLVVTADVPLLTSESVQAFLELCGDGSADLYFPLVPRDLVEEKFPGTKRTYVRFVEGTYTGGNIFLINPQVIERCTSIGQELVSLRKSPLALAKRVGIPMVVKLLLRRLYLSEVEKKASRLLGIQGRAVICPFPEIGVDMDKPSDYQIILKFLTRHNCSNYDLNSNPLRSS